MKVHFILGVNADIPATKAVLTRSFQGKYGSSFVNILITANTNTKKCQTSCVLPGITYYVTAVLTIESIGAKLGTTDFVANGLMASLKSQGLCSDAKPCKAGKPADAWSRQTPSTSMSGCIFCYRLFLCLLCFFFFSQH